MAEFIMCKGLPGSGKSAWAEAYCRDNPGYVRVNKDDIRTELASTGWKWSHKGEREDVIPRRDCLIHAVLAANGSVVSDDTNLSPDHQRVFETLARSFGATFRVQEFTTSIEECIRRDNNRTAKVGGKVIREMAHKYNWPPRPVLPSHDQPEHLVNAIICDLDGTLSLNVTGRSFYDASRADEDALCGPIARIIGTYYRTLGYHILYVTGRFERDREPTERFLSNHNCPPGPLWMRPNGNNDNDAIIKEDIYRTKIHPGYRVEFVLDDRDRVVEMWRGLGLTCLQVAPGDF